MPPPDGPLLEVVARVVAHEWLVRGLDPATPSPAPPPGAGPVTVLAAGAFPVAALERRRRVRDALNDPASVLDLGSIPSRPPSALDLALDLHDGREAVRAGGDEDAIRNALADAVEPGRSGAAARSEARARWQAAFDQAAAATPVRVGHAGGWDRTAYARLEASSLLGDRFFGRKRPRAVWSTATEAVQRAGSSKRRRWR